MDVAALRAAIAARPRARATPPFLVVGTAGSVSTGAVDPLPAIAAICRAEDLWFHVDGAYGGVRRRGPRARRTTCAGSREADSVAVDPHKWLYAPLEAGCALVRDRGAAARRVLLSPALLPLRGAKRPNYVDYGPQNSRGFRALKVWLALRQVGAAGYRRMIGDDIRLARRARRRGRARTPSSRRPREPQHRDVPLRARGPARAARGGAAVEEYLNELNQALLDRLQKGGEVFVSNAVLGGRYVLRACIVNFHTARADVEALPEIVVTNGRALDATMRPAELA